MGMFKRFPALYAEYKARQETKKMAALASLADLISSELDEANAPNFFEVHFVNSKSGRSITLCAQRGEHPTPAQLYGEARGQIAHLQSLLEIKDSVAGKLAIKACADHFQEAWEHGFINRPEQDMIDVTTAIRNFAETYQGGKE